MAVPNRVRFKATDIYDSPENGKRYEVIDGDLYVSPPPVTEHQGATTGLCRYLLPHIYGQGLGRLFTAPIGVELDDENGIQPDLIFIAKERLEIVGRRGIEGAPDLVVEILSPSTRARDRGIKLRRYAAAGVRYYWIVDPRTRSLDELRLGEGGYKRVGTYGPGARLRPELFPGLEIPIDHLWV